MTPAEFSAVLREIGWTQRRLAGLLGCDTNLPTRWARGTAPVPREIRHWLRTLAHFHLQHPVPDWRVKVVIPVPGGSREAPRVP